MRYNGSATPIVAWYRQTILTMSVNGSKDTIQQHGKQPSQVSSLNAKTLLIIAKIRRFDLYINFHELQYLVKCFTPYRDLLLPNSTKHEALIRDIFHVFSMYVFVNVINCVIKAYLCCKALTQLNTTSYISENITLCLSLSSNESEKMYFATVSHLHSRSKACKSRRGLQKTRYDSEMSEERAFVFILYIWTSIEVSYSIYTIWSRVMSRRLSPYFVNKIKSQLVRKR